jgi:hypothetical protein
MAFLLHHNLVAFNTGAAQKDPEIVSLKLPQFDKDHPVDYNALGR